MAKPAILTRLESQLRRKGMNPGEAAAVAQKTLERSGSLKKGSSTATAKGEKRSAMGAAGRAKDRAAKASGHKASDYKYNSKTNRASLR
jgi:hypothetical protein